MEQEEKLCDKVETVSKFIYLGDRVSVGAGCEAAVTVRARCWCVKFRECSELLCGRRFPIDLKVAVYKSYVRTAILYGSEAWCLIERWEFTKNGDIHGESNVWSTAHRQKKIYGFDVHVGFL